MCMASRIASQNRWPALLHLAGLILDCWHHMASVPSLTTLRYPWTSCQPFDGSYLAGQNPNQTLSGTLFGTNMEGKNLFVKEHGVPRGHSPFWFQGAHLLFTFISRQIVQHPDIPCQIGIYPNTIKKTHWFPHSQRRPTQVSTDSSTPS